jgi:serine/threonine-protein kinase
MAKLSAGTLVDGRYEIVRLLSEGGMGAVYVVEHRFLRKQLALKVLHAELARDADALARFEREARAASRIDHPNVVRVTDFGRTEAGEPYLVMELLAGHTLADELTQGQHLPPGRARFIAVEVLRGLEEANLRGVVHRDLKPENVILVPGPESNVGGEAVKVVDFGIAQLRTDGDQRMTSTGAVMGTPLYMAPEQVRGQADLDARVDVYAVGVMLYEMLAGRTPYEGDTFGAIAHEILSAKPQPLATVAPEVDPAWSALVMHAFAGDREQRFASARQLREALERLPATAAPEAYRQARASRLTDLPRGPQVTPPPLPAPASEPVPALLPEAFLPVDAPALELDLPPPKPAPPPPPVRRPIKPFALLGWLVASIVFFVVWQGLSHAPPATHDPRPFSVIDLPPHAHLYLDGAPVTSPFRISDDAGTHRLRIEAHGYATKMLLITADSDHVLDGKLDGER